MFVDIYTHILPKAFWQNMGRVAPNLENIGKRMAAVAMLHDLDKRFADMDKYGEYCQIISLPNPSLEEVTNPATGPELARIANDAMAELVAKNRDRFPAFVAALAMNNMDETMKELHRAIRDLGAKGVQIFTNIGGKPLDLPEFRPLFAAMAAYDLPIWMHPARSAAAITDYASESRSRYEMWWCFGWPYETSVAMVRLVLSGLFDRHPKLKLITHHLGGMIPYFEGRVDGGMAVLGNRTTDEDYSKILPSLKRPHAEYFKLFYGDTAMFGGFLGTKCGLDYFGADQVVFSTDAPFGPVKETFDVIGRLKLKKADAAKIYQKNAEKLMNMKFG